MDNKEEIKIDNENEQKINLEAEDSPKIKERISELPDDMKTFFSNLDPQTRRIICSDEGLLERSNEELKPLFDTMITEVEKQDTKPMMDSIMGKSGINEISNNNPETEQSLDEDDKKLVAKWQEELDRFRILEISGDVVKDYNEIIKLSEENPEAKLASPDDNKQDVLQKLVQTVETWRHHLEKNENIKASPSREKMKSIFIDILKQKHIIGTKFVQYYAIQDSLDKDKK